MWYSPRATGLTPPYAVPASDWTVINDRVAVTIEAQNIAPEIEKYIPNYPDLLRVCTTWRSATWSGLIAQAVSTELFGNDAAKVLGQLSSDLSGVKPGDPVPASVSFIITVQFQALALTAGQQDTTASGLAGQIAAFVSANRAADASLEKLPLDGWSPIAGPIGSLDDRHDRHPDGMGRDRLPASSRGRRAAEDHDRRPAGEQPQYRHHVVAGARQGGGRLRQPWPPDLSSETAP